MKMTKISVMVLAAFISTSAFAALKAPKLQTRADVIVLPDDSVVLADPFIDSDATQQGGGPMLQLLNPRIYQTIAVYKQVSEDITRDLSPGRNSVINAILNQLLDKRTKLRFFGLPSAEEMNKYCFAGRPIYTIPSGATVQQAACTRGDDTFIVKPLFMKLSIRDQAMLLIHERLTTVADDRGWINFVAIAKYTTGLNTFLDIYNDQVRKVYRSLTDDEHMKLTNFYAAIKEIEYRNAPYGQSTISKWTVHKNGGGFVDVSAIVSPSAFVAMGTMIPENSEVGDNARILNIKAIAMKGTYNAEVEISSPLKISEGAVLENVSFEYYPPADYKERLVRVGANSVLKNVRFIELKKEITIGNDTVMKDSLIYNYNTYIGNNVSITDSTTITPTLKLGNGVVLQNSKIDYNGTLATVANDEQLINQTVNEKDIGKYYPAGVTPKAFSQTIKIPVFKCVLTEKLEKKIFGWEESMIDANGDGAKMTGWGTYNGRNGLKKEYEYNYSDTVINVNFRNFARTKDPVTMLDGKGRFVAADYLKSESKFGYNVQNICVASAIGHALSNAGFKLAGVAIAPISFE